MLIYLFIISLLTRFVFLFFGHPSITHDEADFYLQGYLLAKTGSEIHGNTFFLGSGLLTAISPVPVYLNALFFSILPKSVITGRLPFAIINSLMPVFAYYIISKLTSNKKLSFITFLVMNFSPWLSYLSAQASYDSPLSFTFYLAAVSTLLTKWKPKIKYLIFILLSFLSFNSYGGIKTSFIFLMITAFVIKSINENVKINFKIIFKSTFISLFMTLAMFFLVYISPGNQGFRGRIFDEIVFFNKAKLEHTVWYERYVPKTPEIVKKITSNKVTVILDSFFDKYLRAFDPRLLFFKGDPHPLYGASYFGLFYLFELVLIFIGIINAHKILGKKINILFPFILMILASPVPVGLSTIADVTIVFRSYPLILPLSFFIAIGGYFFLSKYKKYFYLLSFFIYAVAFGYFFFIFQSKIKYFSSEQWHYSQKVLSENIKKLREEYESVYVFTNEPTENALLYDYYQVKDGRLVKESLAKIGKDSFKIGNVHIEERCPKEKLNERNFYIIKRDVCDVRKNKAKSADYKLTPYIEAYDRSGTMYWQLTNL